MLSSAGHCNFVRPFLGSLGGGSVVCAPLGPGSRENELFFDLLFLPFVRPTAPCDGFWVRWWCLVGY